MLPDKMEHCIVFMNSWDVSDVFWSFSKCTVDRGLRETVTYRNALGFFPDLGIEMVRAPPLRATETTVT